MSLTPPRATDPTAKPSLASNSIATKQTERPKLRELDDVSALRELRKLARVSTTTIELLRDLESSNADRSEAIEFNPEDLVESPKFRFRKIADRENPQAEERACIEFQRAVAVAKAEVIETDAQFRLAGSETDKIHIAQKRKTELLQSLANLYHDIGTEVRENQDFEFYRFAKDALKLKRDAIYKKIEEVENVDNDKTKLQRLNIDAIRVNRLLLKVQIRLAGMFLNDRANVKGRAAVQPAIMTLVGAHNSAELLMRELHFRNLRLHGASAMREIESTDWAGNIGLTTDIDNLNVTIEPPTDGDEPKIKVRQRRWVNVHTSLDNIRKHIKRGEITEARKKIETLLSLYRINRVRVRESNKYIARDLKELNSAIPQTCAEGVTPDKSVISDVAEKIEQLKAKISCPKHWVWMDVEYKDISAAVRGHLHTLVGNKHDYTVVLHNKALIEYYAKILRTAQEKGELSKRNHALIKRGTERLSVWTGRGFVYPKQFSCIDLGPALECVNAGVDFEKEQDDEHQAKIMYGRAADMFEAAGRELDGNTGRLGEIKRIVDGIKERGHSTYLEFRQEDINRRTEKLLACVEAKKYDDAINQIGGLRGRYFSENMVEPGFKRAANLLNQIQELVLRAKKFDAPEQTIKKIKARLELFKRDIAHYESFRVIVSKVEDGSGLIKYITPGTTLQGLISTLHHHSIIQTNNPWVLIATQGVIPQQQRDGIKLDDTTPVILLANKKPNKSVTVPKPDEIYDRLWQVKEAQAT